MSFKARIEAIRHYYGIFQMDEWSKLTTAMVLRVPNVGKETLEHLQLYLAAHKVNLSDSPSWEYWQKQSGARIAQVLSEADVRQRCPFVVLVDNQEKQPFSFSEQRIKSTDISRDVRRMLENEEIDNAYWDVPREVVSLGASRGDYSIKGLVGECHWERKSLGDCVSTVLGNDERIIRFERELEFLSTCRASGVIVEANEIDCVASIGDTKHRKAPVRRNTYIGRLMSWRCRWPNVQWWFSGNRAFAEMTLFRLMFRAWRKQQGEKDSLQDALNKEGRKAFIDFGI